MSGYQMYVIRNSINNYQYYGYTKHTLIKCMAKHVEKSNIHISKKTLIKRALEDDIHELTLYYMMQQIDCNELYFNIHTLSYSSEMTKRQMKDKCQDLQRCHSLFRRDFSSITANILDVTRQIDTIRSVRDEPEEEEYQDLCPWRQW